MLGCIVFAAPVNILIVGAGGLGLWTLVLAKHICMAGDENVCLKSNLIVADSNVRRLKQGSLICRFREKAADAHKFLLFAIGLLQIEKLVVAKDHGCSHVLHWNETSQFKSFCTLLSQTLNQLLAFATVVLLACSFSVIFRLVPFLSECLASFQSIFYGISCVESARSHLWTICSLRGVPDRPDQERLRRRS